MLKLSDFQYSEPLVFYTCLKPYLEALLTILAKNSCFDEPCQKASMLAIYRAINTVVYNHTLYDEKEGEMKGSQPSSVGIINTAAKFKSFQEEVKTAIVAYREVFQEDNIVNLLDLLAGKYLKLSSIELWENDPENFIEVEDELQYIRESHINHDCAYNFLAYVLCNRILEYFQELSHPWLANQLSYILENRCPNETLLSYARENLSEFESEGNSVDVSTLIEDAILSLTGLLPSIYRYKSISEDNRIKVEVILDYLEGRISDTDSKLLKRRYCLLLSLWVDELNVATLLDYLAKSCSILFSSGTSDIVIKFVAMTTFRDILRIVEAARTTHKKKSITEEESSVILKAIEDRLDYRELFESISPI